MVPHSRPVRLEGGDYYGAVNSKVSLIDESGARYVRMANLACVGSHAVNGVAALHSGLLTREVLADFHALWPEKFSNKTNGVTPRRWVVLSNPGLTRLIKARGYDPRAFYLRNDELREVIDLLRAGFFSRGDTALFRPLIDDLLTDDPFMVVADYAEYAACQERVGRAYSDSETWARMSILNVARSGPFSSDRTIREYCEDIWMVTPQPIRLLTPQEVKVGVLQ